jgi:pimeloyl-ACP methyl ester carboxylesterase
MGLGAAVFTRQSRALQTRPDQQSALTRVQVPSLVLCGEHDALCPPERHRLMASLISGAGLVVVPGAGHLPTLEQPEAVNSAMGAWLAC